MTLLLSTPLVLTVCWGCNKLHSKVIAPLKTHGVCSRTGWEIAYCLRVEHKLTDVIGDLCGAIFIDEEFDTFIRLHVGDEAWSKLGTRQIQRVMSDWDSIKKGFFESSDEDWPVDVLPETFSFSSWVLYIGEAVFGLTGNKGSNCGIVSACRWQDWNTDYAATKWDKRSR